MSESYPVPTEPEGIVASRLARSRHAGRTKVLTASSVGNCLMFVSSASSPSRSRQLADMPRRRSSCSG
jgi:hypothetical protein